MANYIHLVFCAFMSVVLFSEVVKGQPIIDPKEVQSLLPDIPKTKNETVAAIVKDAVIQEAVQSIVRGGTLSGLVVKKNTVILPAAQPDVILGQSEQILTAPLSHLEDIRKNITATAAEIAERENSEIAKVDEFTVAEVIPVNDKTPPDSSGGVEVPEFFTPETAPEHLSETLIAQALIRDEEEPLTKLADQLLPITEKLVVPGILASQIKLPDGVVPGNISLPAVISDEISKPIIAILHPEVKDLVRNSEELPLSPAGAESSSSSSTTGVEDLSKEIFEYGARIPVAVITSEENEPRPAFKIEMRSAAEEKSVENVVAVFTDENLNYENDGDDMVAAEDIIFRPLFRYRQEENERRRILENRSYQRPGYKRYRPSYSSSYDNYSYPRRNSYKKPQRSRYYNDYDN